MKWNSIQKISEASGVGIINVPPALLKQIQQYVCSVLLTLAYKVYEKNPSPDLYEPLKRFQQKYGATILSDAKLKQMVNSTNTIKLPKDEIYNALPQNVKNNPKTKELVDQLTMKLIITNQLSDRGGSSALYGNNNILEIGIPSIKELSNASPDGLIRMIDYSASAIEHELQHTIQQSVYGKLNHKDRQTHQHKDYRSSDAAYKASGIEFGPMVKDIINRCKLWLEQNVSTEYSKPENIKKSIEHAIATLGQGNIIKFLKDYKQNKDANKAMKLIYKNVSDYYDNDLSREYPELNSNVNDDTPGIEDSHRHLDYPEAGESILGDIWLSYYQHYDSKPQGLGPNYNELETVVFERPYGKVEISLSGNDIYVSVRTGERSSSFNFTIPKDSYKLLINNMNYFYSLPSLKQLQVRAEEEGLESVDLNKTSQNFEQMNDDASYFNDDPNKKITIDYDENENNIYVAFKGARDNLIIQENGKKYYVSYNDKGSLVQVKQFNEIFELILDFYYDYGTERNINKLLRYTFDEGAVSSVDNVKSYIDYLKEKENSKEAVMQENEELDESSMRSWMDVIEYADIEKVNEDVLDEEDIEEVARFDAFAGQDVNDFLDKTGTVTDRNGLTKVTELNGYDIYRNKNLSSIGAYDKNGKLVALVSGFISDFGNNEVIFNEEMIAGSVKGVVYFIYEFMLSNGISLLSDVQHSAGAEGLWAKLVRNHTAYAYAEGEIIREISEKDLKKLYGPDGSIESEFQILIVP